MFSLHLTVDGVMGLLVAKDKWTSSISLLGRGGENLPCAFLDSASADEASVGNNISSDAWSVDSNTNWCQVGDSIPC